MSDGRDTTGAEADAASHERGPENEQDEISDPVDLPGTSAGGLSSSQSHENTSDALYIVRESNIIEELDAALRESGIQLKEDEQ